MIPHRTSIPDMMFIYQTVFKIWKNAGARNTSYRSHGPLYIIRLVGVTWNYTERKRKRRVNFIPKFHSSLKKFVKYFTMITKRYMYGTKVPNFNGLWSTSLELLKFIGSYPTNLEIKIKLKINIGCAPSCCRCCPNSPLDRVNQSIDSSHRDVNPFIDQRIP